MSINPIKLERKIDEEKYIPENQKRLYRLLVNACSQQLSAPNPPPISSVTHYESSQSEEEWGKEWSDSSG